MAAVRLDASDLESYVSEYKGRTAISRALLASTQLETLSERRHLACQALILAVPLIKSSTLDTDLYEQVVNRIKDLAESAQNHAPGSSHAPSSTLYDDAETKDEHPISDLIETKGEIDEEWVATTSLKARRELEKLEVELKTYSTNMIKESIRLTHHSIASTLRSTGDFEGAIRNFTKSRDFGSAPSHELDASMGIIELSLLTRHYNQTLPAIIKSEFALKRLLSKMEGAATAASHRVDLGEGLTLVRAEAEGGPLRVVETGAQSRERQRKMKELEELNGQTTARLRIAKGVALLGSGQYEAASREFINVQGDLGDWEGKVLSSSDVATYAILTSLASQSRSSLRTNLLENKYIRHFCDEGSSHYATDLVEAFVDAKYERVIKLLAEHKWRHTLDPHLHSHIARIEGLIRQRAIVQYLQPYQSVQLSKMAKSFGNQALEDHVIGLIKAGTLPARIDMIQGVVNTHAPDARKNLFRNVIKQGEDAARSTKKAYLHMQMLQAGIKVEAKGGSSMETPAPVPHEVPANYGIESPPPEESMQLADLEEDDRDLDMESEYSDDTEIAME